MALFLDRPVNELDPVERAVLHIGTYELLYRPEVPWRVVVNESVELAKMFGAEQSHKFINGVLDKIARKVRVTEISNVS
jgi:transcription antitermination protein NusB